MTQIQTSAPSAAQANQTAASTERLAQSAIDVAQQALQQARATGVNVKPLGDRILITMPSSDGISRTIELSADGKSLLSVDGIATTAIAPPAPARRNEAVPAGVLDLTITVCAMIAATAILLPVARAFARRMDRKDTSPTLPSDASQRLTAIERAVEAVAVEVERISEGQRFTTKVLTERVRTETEVR